MLDIRLCRADDLPAVRDLMRELAEVAGGSVDLAVDDLRVLLDEMDRAPEVYLNLVGTLDGRVVGFVSAIFYRTLFHRGGTALVNELIVTRRERGQGLGRALLARARDEAMARGMDELELGTEAGNHAALRFYRDFGFDEEYVLLGMEFDRDTGSDRKS